MLLFGHMDGSGLPRGAQRAQQVLRRSCTPPAALPCSLPPLPCRHKELALRLLGTLNQEQMGSVLSVTLSGGRSLLHLAVEAADVTLVKRLVAQVSQRE